ncbi:MAG TPA: hypothetical protein VGQ23_21085 [Burkholderiaceae bacterium]|jgi:hypothetical protein|nr:hypothetical protein [Burkholderiaceae bacterium]
MATTGGISPDTAASIAAQQQAARDSAAMAAATAQAQSTSSAAQQRTALVMGITGGNTELIKQLGSHLTRGSSAG